MVEHSDETLERVVKPNGVKAWCARNDNWSYYEGALIKKYTLESPAQAAAFAAQSVRRASTSGVRLTLIIDGTTVELIATPAGPDFTSRELLAARRYDLKPRHQTGAH